MAERGADTAKRTGRGRRWLARLIVLFVVALVVAEIVARTVLGLGDPPLLIHDPEIEYYFKPGVYHRLGNTVSYNRFSQRSDDFDPAATPPDELRVVVIGDSVVNGGVLTDHADLATTRLQQQLAATLDQPVRVLNLSAGSWGPINQLAYVDRFGLFEPDVILYVVNHEDAYDVPETPLPATQWTERTPVSAAWEGVMRYVPRYWTEFTWKVGLADPPPPKQPTDAEYAASLDAFAKLLRRCRAVTPRVVVIDHLDTAEYDGPMRPGRVRLRAAAAALDVPVHSFESAFRAAREAGERAYRGHIHPNAKGQAVMADVMSEIVRAQLATPVEPTGGSGNSTDG